MRHLAFAGMLLLALILPATAGAAPPEGFQVGVVEPTVTVLRADGSGGSGTVIGGTDRYWIILTAAHVVRDHPVISVSVDGGRTQMEAITAAVSESEIDLALVFLPRADLSAIAVAAVAAEGTHVMAGDTVWTSGAGALLPPWQATGLAGPDTVDGVYTISSSPTVGGDSGGGVFYRDDAGMFRLYGVIQAGPPGDASWVTLAAPLDNIWLFLQRNHVDDFVGPVETAADAPLASGVPEVGQRGSFGEVIACDTAEQAREIIADPARFDFWAGQQNGNSEAVCGRWAIAQVDVRGVEPAEDGQAILTVGRGDYAFVVIWTPDSAFTADDA